MVMLQKVWWKEYSQVHAEYFYFSPVAFPFLRIAGRLEYCYLYILWLKHPKHRQNIHINTSTLLLTGVTVNLLLFFIELERFFI